ncbi:hypothetical protein BC940DRAFT_335158 [Gongronella butleri]|nr:hypothetical protein BC940DRAFT_335158 [Gongronella butleri]
MRLCHHAIGTVKAEYKHNTTTASFDAKATDSSFPQLIDAVKDMQAQLNKHLTAVMQENNETMDNTMPYDDDEEDDDA